MSIICAVKINSWCWLRVWVFSALSKSSVGWECHLHYHNQPVVLAVSASVICTVKINRWCWLRVWASSALSKSTVSVGWEYECLLHCQSQQCWLRVSSALSKSTVDVGWECECSLRCQNQQLVLVESLSVFCTVKINRPSRCLYSVAAWSVFHAAHYVMQMNNCQKFFFF